MIPEFWTLINDLSSRELIDLISAYEDYLENARQEDLFHQGWIPVSIAEFWEVEFRMLEEDDTFDDVTPSYEEHYSDDCLDDDIYAGMRSAEDY